MTGLAVLRWCDDRRYLLPIYDRHFVETLVVRRRSLDSWRWREPPSPEEHQRLCEIREKPERGAAE